MEELDDKCKVMIDRIPGGVVPLVHHCVTHCSRCNPEPCKYIHQACNCRDGGRRRSRAVKES